MSPEELHADRLIQLVNTLDNATGIVIVTVPDDADSIATATYVPLSPSSVPLSEIAHLLGTLAASLLKHEAIAKRLSEQS